MTKQTILNQIKEMQTRADKYREYIGEICYDGEPLEIMRAAKEALLAEQRIEQLQAELSIDEAQAIAYK